MRVKNKNVSISDVGYLTSDTFQHKLSLIMPCYNEGNSIYKNLQETIRTMNDFRKFNIDYECL